jgi:hypothetical protein
MTETLTQPSSSSSKSLMIEQLKLGNDSRRAQLRDALFTYLKTSPDPYHEQLPLASWKPSLSNLPSNTVIDSAQFTAAAASDALLVGDTPSLLV